MRYLFILLLAGCTTTSKNEATVEAEHNQLKCLGYCDLVIQSVEVETTGKVKVTAKRSPHEPREPIGEDDDE